MDNKTSERDTIDLLHICKCLLKRIWVIIISSFAAAAIFMSYAAFFLSPQYSSSIMLYVNNGAISLGNTQFSISASEITAAQSLVKTYGVILNNRTTLERIIDKAELSYSYKDLSKMIESSQANGTEIMKVTVTTGDPYEAAKIANTIAEVLPVRISEIVDGASMEVVDSAVPSLQKVGPSIRKYTVMGFVLGAVLSAIALAIPAILDDKIRDEEYIRRTYDYPILGKVPDLSNTGNKTYGKYYSQDLRMVRDKGSVGR